MAGDKGRPDMQEKGRRIISPEKQNKSRFGSGRLTVANEKALQKFILRPGI